MKFCVAILALFIHSINGECKFSNPTFNSNLVSFYKSSNEHTMDQFKNDLKDLRVQLDDFKKSIDPKCMEFVQVKDVFDGLGFMLQMLEQFDEKTKKGKESFLRSVF